MRRDAPAPLGLPRSRVGKFAVVEAIAPRVGGEVVVFLDEPAHDHSGVEGLEVVLSVDDVPGGAHALRAGGETPGVTAVRNLGDGLGRGRRVRLGRGGVARVVTAVIVAAVVVVVVAVFVQQIATDAASGFARVLGPCPSARRTRTPRG